MPSHITEQLARRLLQVRRAATSLRALSQREDMTADELRQAYREVVKQMPGDDPHATTAEIKHLPCGR